MRPVVQNDITAAARALLAVPEAGRDSLCARLMREADWADHFTRKVGRPHPFWGNGTLFGAAQGHPRAAMPAPDDEGYRNAVMLVEVYLDCRRRFTDL